MVLRWLLKSVIFEPSKAFFYVNSTQELWSELTERYGENNGPMSHQLEREI